MRIPCIIAGVILIAAYVIGCSKHSSPQTRGDALKNLQEMNTFMTNSLDVLQAKYQENCTNIVMALVKLDRLRKSYGTNDPSYLQQRQKFEQIHTFQQLLASKIESDKADLAIKARTNQH